MAAADAAIFVTLGWMSSPNPLKTPELEFKSLLFLVVAATALFVMILWPFFGAVCWAVFIAIVFWPLHQRFLLGSVSIRLVLLPRAACCPLVLRGGSFAAIAEQVATALGL